MAELLHDVPARILQLVALSALEYEQTRKNEAKKLGIRPSVLDKLVEAKKNNQKTSADSPFVEINPYEEDFCPRDLLSEISSTIRQYIVLEQYQADAITLWIAFTWMIDQAAIAPLLVISAPEKSCGKTQLLDLVGRLVAKPLPAANSTPAALFRSVEKWSPTLLVDEADTFIKHSDELIGLINAGHSRSNAFVLRVVGDNHEPKSFRVWGAKALAGIALERHLPDATMSRAIVIEMRRKLPGEQVQRLRHSIFDEHMLKEKLSRLALDFADKVHAIKVTLPEVLTDRQQDNFESLFLIASFAGEEWLSRVTDAALKISAANISSNETGNELLSDIRVAFEVMETDKLSTLKLINALLLDEEGAWGNYNRGKPISPRQIAKRLSSYGITSKTLRDGYLTFKGYELSQFEDAFKRYLPGRENVTSHGNDKLEGSNHAGADVTYSDSVTVTANKSVTLEPMPDKDCDSVTDFLKLPIKKCVV
ncbi:MAG TPA: DUF3631 domain-containing protein [Methylotenera sp.]|nr:DUF3631 domain-containing protein [Methylotenera sp.]HPH06109.1 DUF3631 domain-containing protein [Methylotenera sp.]